MVKWNLPIDTCMFYGDSIKIYTFMINVSIEFKGETRFLEINSRRSILILKSQIKKLFGIKISEQILLINEENVIDNIESMLFYKLTDSSHVIVEKVEKSQGLPAKKVPIKLNALSVYH